MKQLQVGLIEPGADTYGVNQLFIVVNAQQQSTETTARTLWLRIANNYKLLAQTAFEFDPVRAAPRHIRAAGAFADDAFQRQRTGAFDDVLVVRREGLGEAHDLPRLAPKGFLQRGTTIFHR